MHDQYVTKRERVERITLVGPMSERNAVLESLHKAGFRTAGRAGPYTDSKMWPKVDVTRFKLVYEREDVSI